MPVNTDLATQIHARYQHLRDNGHNEFVAKADVCDAYLRGDQWRAEDKAALELVKRPALTINKILPTVENVLGEQIANRAEISYRPSRGGDDTIATMLTKVFKHISVGNQLDWIRSEVFADGVVRSRGFLDIRLDHGQSMTGEVRYRKLNAKNVLIDADAEDYDPDNWNDVIVTKWLTADDIAVLYNEDDAEDLKHRAGAGSSFPFGYDMVDGARDRFGERQMPLFIDPSDATMRGMLRNIRVIERQYRKLDKQLHFVEKATGEMRPVPEDFDRNRIAHYRETFGFEVIKKLVRRIRWTTVADNVVLHDEWSPYRHLTVVPYFPLFRDGRTIGKVENLLGPQELLNKSSSQELHVINTSANSGWKVKAGSLSNMSPEELAQRGAQTGLVLELVDGVDSAEKITPNPVPQGFDRVSYKAEEHIKTISGVNDSMLGTDREDVAARAIERKKQSGVTSLAKAFDNLTRFDFFVARNTLDLIQDFYTEERVMTIVADPVTGDTETFTINQVDAAGRIVNDITLGEYAVTVTSVPARETLEDSQFDQALALREIGVAIPDEVIINSSRLQNKGELIRKIVGDKDGPEAARQAELAARQAEAAVSKEEGEAAAKHADARLKDAKAAKEQVVAGKEAATPPEMPGGPDPVEQELAIDQHEHDKQMDFLELARQREKDANELALEERQQAIDAENDRLAQAQAAAQAALQPQSSGD
jgi:hypothetical protein